MADRDEFQNPNESDSPTPTSKADRRDTPRIEFTGAVELEFLDVELIGQGQNQSAQGVFFVADRLPKVRVRTSDGERIGELVRIQPQGDGRAGIAVRLLD
ncbi:MAG: hypothetical protein AAF196_04730 [Planctomycetota bacterium]